MSPIAISADVADEKIAIVGSGCAGLAAAWALRSSGKEVHVFEKSPKLGGHTNTQVWRKDGQTTPVDTGFIVLNTATYPNFIRFLDEVGIQPTETAMTFSVSRNHGEFEWSGEPQGIFAQRRNLFRLRHWRLIFDIVRFNQFALDLLSSDDEKEERLSNVKAASNPEDVSIGEYLERHGYSQAFRDDYLIPMTAAVWSTAPDKASLEFPAKTLIRFLWNHHLLSTIAARPAWLTISGGSQRYIDAIVACYPKGHLHLHTSCEVTNVLRPSNATSDTAIVSWVDMASGRIETDTFSHVILACHGDQVLPILSGQTEQRTKLNLQKSPALYHDNDLSQIELDVFSAFETTENVCYLHSDTVLMPRREKTWTSWNYLTNTTPHPRQGNAAVSLTYNMNILQHIPLQKFGHVLVTMNPDIAPDPALTQGKFQYRHPLYTSASVRAQRSLKGIQNTRRVSYCGAWTNYGFHEDGFSSGLRVAVEHLGADLPFEFVDSTYSRGHKPVFGTRDYVLRIVLQIILLSINIVHFVVQLPVINTITRILAAVLEAMFNLMEASRLL